MGVPSGSRATLYQKKRLEKGRGQGPGAKDLFNGRTLMMMMMMIIVMIKVGNCLGLDLGMGLRL